MQLYVLKAILCLGCFSTFCRPVKLSTLKTKYQRELQKQHIYTRNLLHKHTPGAQDLRVVKAKAVRGRMPARTHKMHVTLWQDGVVTKPTRARLNRAGNNINVVENRSKLDQSRLKSKQILARLAMMKGLIARM